MSISEAKFNRLMKIASVLWAVSTVFITVAMIPWATWVTVSLLAYNSQASDITLNTIDRLSGAKVTQDQHLARQLELRAEITRLIVDSQNSQSKQLSTINTQVADIATKVAVISTKIEQLK